MKVGDKVRVIQAGYFNEGIRGRIVEIRTPRDSLDRDYDVVFDRPGKGRITRDVFWVHELELALNGLDRILEDL